MSPATASLWTAREMGNDFAGAPAAALDVRIGVLTLAPVIGGRDNATIGGLHRGPRDRARAPDHDEPRQRDARARRASLVTERSGPPSRTEFPICTPSDDSIFVPG